MRNDPTKCSVCGFDLGEPRSPLGPSGVDRRRHMVCPAHSPFRVEPCLSLSEIEARLTEDIRRKADTASGRVYYSSASMTKPHRAWLDVILAALGKEQP